MRQALTLSVIIAAFCYALSPTSEAHALQSFAVTAGSCPEGTVPAYAVANDKGVEVGSGRCVPGSRSTSVPSQPDFLYDYTPICRDNVPDSCGPLECEGGPPPPARMYKVFRTELATGYRVLYGGGCYEPSDGEEEVTPDKVREALKQVDIPAAAILVQPPNGKTLVNFKTIVSTESTVDYPASVKVVGKTVLLRIHPAKFTWDFGDGAVVTRTDHGRAWVSGTSEDDVDDSYTYHEYTSLGMYSVGLTVTWTAQYKVEGEEGDWQDVPGEVPIASEPVALEVISAVPRLVQ